MLINEINFPNEIIDAIDNNNLVVFAGAGVSMGVPTSLPDFSNLAKRIAEGTGETLWNDEACENFLGNLKANGIDVNRRAAELLSDSCLQHNQAHEAIIDLFTEPSKIKIVTTNYDQMFEQVLDSRNLNVPVYNAPALPLGDDIEGIIHVHGNINKPKYMVLTDEDFGKAYLTEGYAARFLIKLFQSYTILFIGYSYNDVILRYLTRAMYRDPAKARFIITDKGRSEDWNTLGLSPVYFPQNDYSGMKEGLVKLGERAKRGLFDWENMIKGHKSEPPRDIALKSEIDFCLESIERTRVLANIICGKEWILYLDKRGIFINLFSPETILSEKDKIWMNWIIDICLGKDDEAFKTLYLKYGNKIHPQFAATILKKLESGDQKISDIAYKDYIIMLDPYIKTSWEIFRLIMVLSQRGLYSLCYKLFVKFFEVQFVLENKPLSSGNELTYKHEFRGEHYQIVKSWEHCKDEFLASYPENLLYFIKDTILHTHDTYVLLAKEDKPIELRKMSMLVIEERDSYSKKDPLYLLCQFFCASFKVWGCKNPNQAKAFLIRCLKEPAALLKKLSLKALRECESISSCEKFDIFITNSAVSFFEGKEQIFLLIREIFNDLTKDRQDKLIDEIESLNTDKNEYPIYNWCVWIKQFCDNNERINRLEEEILSRNNFRPREHPELDLVVRQAVWLKDQSPITQEQMLALDMPQLIDLLNNYKEEFFEGPSRWGLLSALSECVKENYRWTLNVVKHFTDGSIKKKDAWQRLMIGLQNSDFEIDQLLELLKQFAEKIEIVEDTGGMSELLLKTLKRKEIKEYFNDRENELFLIVETIWNHRNKNYINSDRLIDIVINSDLGNVLLSSLYMLYYCDEEQGIPERYKSFWEKNLNLKTEEKNIALCVLVGHFNLLYLRDQEWCDSEFVGILSGADQQSFAAAWEGMVYYSHYLNKDLVDVMESIFLEAVKHFDWLKGEVRYSFIDSYLLLLIYAVMDPCLEHIPAFYKVAKEYDKERFIEGIEYKLRDMDDNEKESVWKGWLKKFLYNRYENIPTKLDEKEKELFINWLPELGKHFEEAVNILCKEKMPQKVDSIFLHRLDESKLVLQFPHSVIGLLTQMLNDGTEFDFYRDYMSNIYNEAEGLSQEEKTSFKEVLLKRGMNICDSSTNANFGQTLESSTENKSKVK